MNEEVQLISRDPHLTPPGKLKELFAAVSPPRTADSKMIFPNIRGLCISGHTLVIGVCSESCFIERNRSLVLILQELH